ncbi:MAG: putative toxin-antitoxin system toxin component, PIN family, partial [Bacteroidota bacterium]
LEDKFRFTELEVRQIRTLLKERLILSTPHTELPDICRDHDDNNVLQLAESTYAEYLITGDKDLLVLEDYKGIKVMNPRRFLDEVIGKKE